jgi:peptidoglycan/LPS O-acetylase OafA/YrhL
VQTHTFPTHLRLDALLFGVLLSYRYHVDPAFRPRVAARRWWMVAAGLVILWLSQQLGQSLTYVVGTALIYLGFGAIVLAAVCAPSNRPWHPAAQFIALVGTFSYSIYLWHTADFAFGNVFLRKAGLDHANYYAILAFKVATAFVVGIVMSKLVELPVLAVRDRLFPARGQGSLG